MKKTIVIKLPKWALKALALVFLPLKLIFGDKLVRGGYKEELLDDRHTRKN